MCKQPHAFLDIETSGLDPVVHEPIEVAYILEPEGVVTNISLDFDNHKADPKALEVNGFGKRTFAPVKQSPDFATQLAEDLEGRVIIGNNVQFDLNFLREFLRRHGETPTWHYNPVDLKALAGGAMGLQPPWDTKELCKELKVPYPEREYHTALEDAQFNKDFYHAIFVWIMETE